MTAPAMSFHLPDAAATLQFGQLLGRSLLPHSVLLLQGNLGSGKTTLVQGIGQGLGITEPIVSPTFTLINEYLEGRLPLYHLDLYRLQATETAALHLETYWDEQEAEPGIVAIEWPERLAYRPGEHLSITLEAETDSGRRIYLVAIGPGFTALLQQLSHWQGRT